jgi:hypothetical protein
MDIGVALRFTTEDKKWIEKIAIGAVLIFTVIGWLAVVGWMLEILRRVVRGEAEVLPPWTNLGKYFVDGLVVGVIGFLWILPIIVVSACLGGLSGIAAGLQPDENAGGGMMIWLTLCLGLISLPYALIVSFLIPPMLGIYALQGTFGAAVNPAKAWRLARANLGGFLVAWLVGSIVGVAASLIGTILCLIGVYPLGAYASAVGGHLYGQAYREGMASLPTA